MIKIVIISHNFRKDIFCKRWRMLAQKNKDLDITLLAPEQWKEGQDKNYSFGFMREDRGEEKEEDNFHIKLIDMTQHKYISWTSKKLGSIIRSIRPDIIFHIGTHLQESLLECIFFKNLFCSSSKIVAFSMRGPQECIYMPKGRTGWKYFRSKIFYYYRKLKLFLVKKNCDSILCHYPDAVRIFLEENFNMPIYIHTQIGVDTEYFKPNIMFRQKIRNKYNLDQAFVFGSAVRFTEDKGVIDIIKALPQNGNWKYLLMGAGNEEETEHIKTALRERNIEDKVIMTGFIEWEEMNQYFNAIDCAIHVPHTTEHWVETFSLAVVQAMATMKPVIGNTSGSVPYQIGKDGIIVCEGDQEELQNAIEYILFHPIEAEEIGRKMRERAEQCFSIEHLTACIAPIFKDIQKGIYDKEKMDMCTYLVNYEE